VTIGDYVEVLDEARRPGGDWERLRLVLYRSVRVNDFRKDEIVHESLVAILKKFREGEPSVTIAPQVAGIVHMQRRRVLQREQRRFKRLEPVGDQLHRLDSPSLPEDDPAEALVSLEELEASVLTVRHALNVVKAENPRQYELIWADLEDVSAVGHLEQVFGKPLKPEAVRALRHRAHNSLAKHIQETRKEASP
jgi:hypothetical protein